MGGLSPLAATGSPAFYTSLGPSATPGGFSGQSFGTPGLPQGFGFPSYGDPLFYFQPAASSFNINRLLGYANGSAVNINVGPTPSTMGFGGLLLGTPFFADSGVPGSGPFGASGLGSFGGGVGPTNASSLMGADPTSSMMGGSALGAGGGIPGVVDPTGATYAAGMGASGLSGLSPQALGMGASSAGMGGLTSLGGASLGSMGSLGGLGTLGASSAGLGSLGTLGASSAGLGGLTSLGGSSLGASSAGLGSLQPVAAPAAQPQQPQNNMLKNITQALVMIKLLDKIADNDS